MCSERDVFADSGEHLRRDAKALDLWSLATNGTQERGEVLQGKMLNNAGAALQQQFKFAGCGTVEVEVAGAVLSEDKFADDTASLGIPKGSYHKNTIENMPLVPPFSATA